MNAIERIMEYKRLAQLLDETPTKETAEILSRMCDDDAKRLPKIIRNCKGFREQQAMEFILSIGRKARPSVRDSPDKLRGKAYDILMEVAEVEQIPDDSE